MTRAAIAIALLLAGGVPAAGSSRSKSADAARRAIEVLEETNAGLRSFVLPNGMTCLVREDHSAPAVSIQVWVGSGSIHEQQYLGGGLSHAVEHMIFKGTGKRDPGDISRDIHDAGGRINAYTTLDRTVFHTDLPSRNWKVGLDVLSDAVMHAAFPADEWEREKEVIVREMAMGRDDPDRVLVKQLWQTAFTVHPYRIPVIGYEEILRGIERDDLASFYGNNYVSDIMITVIVGDIDAAEVEQALRDTFSNLPRKARAPVVLPAEPSQIAPRFARRTGSYKTSRLKWAYHTVPLSHPDTPALDVLANVVGGGNSCRLVRNIKEELQLVHEIGAGSYTPKDPGLFVIGASFDPDREQDVLDAIEKEVSSWTTSRFSRKEVDKAVRAAVSSALGDLRTMHGQAASYARGHFYAADPRFSQRYIEQLMKVTPSSLREAAAKYLRGENRTLVLLTPEPPESDESREEPGRAGQPTKLVLPNGIPLIVREDRRLPFVHLCATLRGGVLSEQESTAGITQLMADLLLRGTSSRSAETIAVVPESLGASVSSFSGHNSFGLVATCLSPDLPVIADLLADCLLNASFPADEVQKQKTLHLARLARKEERPFFLAREQLRGMLFPRHPYRWGPLGLQGAIKEIDRQDLLAHHGRLVTSGNLAVSVFGDVDEIEAKDVLGRALSRVSAGPPPSLALAVPAAPLPARAEKREPRQQTILLAGVPGIQVGDPRADALEILRDALSGLSSDMGIEIRDKRGLAYYVGAYNRPGLAPGTFVIYAGTREDAVGKVEALVRAEISRVTGEGLRDEELARAKERLIAGHEMGLQDNASLAMTCALNELYGLGFAHSFETKRRIEAVTGNDVREAAASILATNRLAVSLVLPESAPAKTEKQ
ncbi:MAG: insulinase family protein [Lentisphaerae bacterium]|nr:insulinase family protein [Lentisphaerota bacterium]